MAVFCLFHFHQYVDNGESWDSQIINGPARHTIHHRRLLENFGQLPTGGGRIAGTYQSPIEDRAVVVQRKDQTFPEGSEAEEKKMK